MSKQTGSKQKSSKTGQAPGDGGGDGQHFYSIGPLSDELGLSTRAIRFYEAKGLISPQRAGANRIYTKRDRGRLLLIQRGKRLGFSLDEIAEYLNLYDAGQNQEPQIRHLLKKVDEALSELELKRADIDSAIAELTAIRAQCLSAIEDGQ